MAKREGLRLGTCMQPDKMVVLVEHGAVTLGRHAGEYAVRRRENVAFPNAAVFNTIPYRLSDLPIICVLEHVAGDIPHENPVRIASSNFLYIHVPLRVH